MRGILGLSLLPLLVAASPLRETSIHGDAAPVLSAANADEIADNYIVVFKKHVNHNSAVEHHSWVNDLHVKTEQYKMDLKKKRSISSVDDVFGGLKHTYNIAGSLLGYSGHFDAEVIEEIRRHPDVSDSRSITIFRKINSAFLCATAAYHGSRVPLISSLQLYDSLLTGHATG